MFTKEVFMTIPESGKNVKPGDRAEALRAGRECLAAALEYRELYGWAVLADCPPDHADCGEHHPKHCDNPGKRPLHRWKEYQARLPTEEEIRDWWERWPTANVGVSLGPVCGEDGLIRIDSDSEEGERLLSGMLAGSPLPPTPEFSSGGGGRGLLFSIPPGVTLPTTVHRGLGEHAELRFQGLGAQTVLPPSRHPSGRRYGWREGRSPSEVPLAPLHRALVEYVRRSHEAGVKAVREVKRFTRTFAASLTGRAIGSVEDRAVAYLRNCPEAVSGHAGHNVTYWVARCVVYGFDLGLERGFELLWSEYNPRCRPAWTEAELLHKCQDADEKPFNKPRGWFLNSAARRRFASPVGGVSRNGATHAGRGQDNEGGPNRDGPDRPKLTDRGNARRVALQHGQDVRFVTSWGAWLVWDGRRWRRSDAPAVRGIVTQVIEGMFREATDRMYEVANQLAGADEGKQEELKVVLKALQATQSWALKSEDARRLNAAVDLLRSEMCVRVDHEELDAHPWLFNCANGTIDLRSGELRPHDRADLLTALCPTAYVPSARCERWEQFIGEVFAGNAKMASYVRRLLGYALTGDVSTHMLPVLWGSGGNGKGTLINTFLKVLGGDYASAANADFLLARSGDRHPTDVACLCGKRLVSCQETGEGRGLNEALVKWLTGGDRLQARRMREDPWEFSPTHKLFLSTNHRPRVRGTDNGIWRRLRLVPFTQRFSGSAEDKGLPGRLSAEAEGILAWAIRGCLEWLREGERPPAEVVEATDEYRNAEDLVRTWLSECCTLHPNDETKRVRSGDLYAAYTAWCERRNERPTSLTAFGDRLTELDLGKKVSNGVWRTGITLGTAPAPAGGGRAGNASEPVPGKEAGQVGLEHWNTWKPFQGSPPHAGAQNSAIPKTASKCSSVPPDPDPASSRLTGRAVGGPAPDPDIPDWLRDDETPFTRRFGE